MIYTDLILVTLIVVYIVDLSGFTDSWLLALSNYKGHKVSQFKPFSCSQCMTWWVGIAYALCAGAFSLPVLAYIALLAWLAAPVAQLMNVIKDAIYRIIDL